MSNIAKLKENDVIEYTFSENRFAVVPVGGCGNLKHWITMKIIEQFNIPYCVLLDSDKGTKEEFINATTISSLRAEGIKAYTTRKREPENYIYPSCLGLADENFPSYSDTDDAKQIISAAMSIKKENVIDYYWTKMSFDQIRKTEEYIDDGVKKYEFSDMIIDFFSLIPN